MKGTNPEVIKIGGKDYVGEAPSISDQATVEFKLWVDEDYELHVQLLGSTGGTCVKTSLVYSVNEYKDLPAKYKEIDKIRGFDITNNAEDTTDVKNNIRFLAAVVKHLLSDKSTVSASDIELP